MTRIFITADYGAAIIPTAESLEEFFARTHPTGLLEDVDAETINQPARLDSLRATRVSENRIRIDRCICEAIPAGYIYAERPAEFELAGIVHSFPRPAGKASCNECDHYRGLFLRSQALYRALRDRTEGAASPEVDHF